MKIFDTDVSKKFLADFQKEYNRLPSIYAVQAYDAAQLILSAASKASVKDAKAFGEALKAADIQSPRGKFKFNTNLHPIQDIYVTEVVKEDGVLTNKTVSKIFTDHGDAYAKDCKI